MRKKIATYLSLMEWSKFIPRFIVAVAIICTLPSLLIPLGFHAEGDGVDYRIPLIKWMIRHGAYPNWPWAIVDDYPILGELLMAPLLAIAPGLARLVPIAAYVLCGHFGALIFSDWVQDSEGKKKYYWHAFAWILTFRPLVMQANLFMVDNLAAAFILGSLCFALRTELFKAALFLGLCMLTRYTYWACAPAVLGVYLFSRPMPSATRALSALKFTSIVAIMVSPVMIRNFLVNGNPVFPLANGFFNGESISAFEGYGRGKDLVSLLLFPFDLLVSNTFGKRYFDYRVGFLFYLQLAAAVWCMHLLKKQSWGFRSYLRDRRVHALLGFTAFHFLFWFFSSPQLRFLLPGLVLFLLVLLWLVMQGGSQKLIAAITASGVFMVLSVHAIEYYSLRSGHSYFPIAFKKNKECFERAGVHPSHRIMHHSRESSLGYFSNDFTFSPDHVHADRRGAKFAYDVDFVYGIVDLQKYPGFKPWPETDPCLMKKIQ